MQPMETTEFFKVYSPSSMANLSASVGVLNRLILSSRLSLRVCRRRVNCCVILGTEGSSMWIRIWRW